MEQKLFTYLMSNWELINVKDAGLTQRTVSMHLLLFRVQICRSICTLCGNYTVNLGESLVFCVPRVHTVTHKRIETWRLCYAGTKHESGERYFHCENM